MSTTRSGSNCNLAVEAMVRKVMSDMVIKSANDSVVSTEETEETASLSTVSDHKISSDVIASKNTKKQKKGRSRSSTSESRKMGNMKKSSSKDKKKKSKTRSKKKGSKISLIEKLIAELHDLEQEYPSGDMQDCNIGLSIESEKYKIPSRILVESRTLSDKTLGYSSDDDSTITTTSLPSVTGNMSAITTPSTATVCTKEFYNDVASKLRPHRKTICIQGDCSKFDNESLLELEDMSVKDNDDNDFQAAFGPNDMRCLALVSHNEMKSTMKDFVIHYKHILKKFRLTGTQSTTRFCRQQKWKSCFVCGGSTFRGRRMYL